MNGIRTLRSPGRHPAEVRLVRAHRRRGSLTLEIGAASVVLAITLASVTHLLMQNARQQQSALQRRVALIEAENVLEHLAAASPEDFQAAASKAPGLSSTAAARLPGATLHIAITPPVAGEAAWRATVQIDWTDAAGLPVRPVRLSTWRHFDLPASPPDGEGGSP